MSTNHTQLQEVVYEAIPILSEKQFWKSGFAEDYNYYAAYVNDMERRHKDWIAGANWREQNPVAPQPVKSAEEILKSHTEPIKLFRKHLVPTSNEVKELKEAILKAMEEYAKQFHPSTSAGVWVKGKPTVTALGELNAKINGRPDVIREYDGRWFMGTGEYESLIKKHEWAEIEWLDTSKATP